ncbi:DUF167 domain-containing protein [Candidatus Woesearchaeota archaeon]|nr:DUF167 domain-containing protein [Candidatus Woesearchaeota archaeon]
MRINIKVKADCSFESIEEISSNNYKINLKSKPENNKANLELIKILSKYFKVDISKIKIIKGKTSKNKIVDVDC